MKTFTTLILICILLSACKTHTTYVPVESVRTEYIDRLTRDSIHLHDSILIRMNADTVFVEKYKTLYRDRLMRDSIFVTDSIQVPYPVEVVCEVNRLSGWQNFLVWCGAITIIILLGILFFRYIKR